MLGPPGCLNSIVTNHLISMRNEAFPVTSSYYEFLVIMYLPEDAIDRLRATWCEGITGSRINIEARSCPGNTTLYAASTRVYHIYNKSTMNIALGFQER
jgi:hypothetical protein